MFIELEIAFTEMVPLRSAQSIKGTSQWGDVSILIWCMAVIVGIGFLD